MRLVLHVAGQPAMVVQKRKEALRIRVDFSPAAVMKWVALVFNGAAPGVDDQASALSGCGAAAAAGAAPGLGEAATPG